MYSERQMRATHENCWDDWIPQSKLHRADGYTKYPVEGGHKIAAFEVELTLKSKSRYDRLARYYADATTIDHVFWLVDRPGMATSIKAILESHSPNIQRHNFITRKEFLAKGWHAPIFDGCFRGKSLKDLMVPQDLPCDSRCYRGRDDLSLLDLRRAPKDLDTWEPPQVS